MSVAADDPIGECISPSIGNRGFEGAVKAWHDGTDEVKDLLKYECEMIYECRYCRNLYRSIPTFLSHKRQLCKTLCRSVAPNTLISKHLEDFSSIFVNDKNTPPLSVKKNSSKGSRHNIVAAFQKRLHTTTISDNLNRVDLYTLPSISRYQPQTTFQDGQQVILRQNPLMAMKEHQPDDGVLLIMPQDSNISQKCGDMTLRRRKVVDVEEKEMTGKELIVLDYIPADIRKHINPATCQCLYSSCDAKNVKPFESLLALAYHLTVTHNRPLNSKEVLRLRKGREGQLLCFLCGTTHGGADKIKAHIQKEHSDIRELHLQQRRQIFDAQNNKSRRKLDPGIYFENRHRSISPTASEIGNEDSADLPVTESMEIEEQSNDSVLSSNADSQSASAATAAALKNGVAAAAASSGTGAKKKFPIIKKKKRARLTMKRKKPQTSSSSKVPKDSTPTEEEAPPKLEKQNFDPEEKEDEEEEMEEDEKEPELEEEEETTSESQNIPELISQTDSMSPRTQTRSPSDESEKIGGGLAVTRSKRTRVPKKFFDYEQIAVKKGIKGQKGSKEPPKKKSRPSEFEFVTPKLEPGDDDMPILQKEPVKPSSTKKTPSTSKKPQSKRDVRSLTSSPTKSALQKSDELAIRKLFKSEFDAEDWVTPDSSFETEPESSPLKTSNKKLPYTPKAAAAASRESLGGSAGSSRRKQRLNISDDHEGNIPKRLESEEKDERTSSKPNDLSLLPIIMSPEDEDLFYKPLKPLFKNGVDGNHQCSECGQTFLSQKEGRRHMLTHVRAVRFRCALCDVGAFYCEDMRVHLMNRHCPSLQLVPDKFQGSAIPCMSAREADELTQVVHQEFPGQFRYTSGKIVTSENPKPHRPDPSIEESILGSIRPPYISPKKERAKVPILSRANKSPSRLVVPVAAVDNNAAASSSKAPTITSQAESRIVTPLKLVRTNITNPGPSSAAADAAAASTAPASILKLPGFKLLKPLQPPPSSFLSNNETSESVPVVEEEAAASPPPESNQQQQQQPSTSASVAAVPPAIVEQLEEPPTPPPPAEVVVQAAAEPPPEPQPQQPEEPELNDAEPLDPVQPDPHLVPGRRSLDPVDPSPSY